MCDEANGDEWAAAIVADPMVRLAMNSDRVSEAELLRVLSQARQALLARGGYWNSGSPIA
jgi:hypothetical protein